MVLHSSLEVSRSSIHFGWMNELVIGDVKSPTYLGYGSYTNSRPYYHWLNLTYGLLQKTRQTASFNPKTNDYGVICLWIRAIQKHPRYLLRHEKEQILSCFSLIEDSDAFLFYFNLSSKNSSFHVVCSMPFIYNLSTYGFSQKCFTTEVKNIKGWLFFKVFNLNLALSS